jgi:hypothetical protein
MPKFGSAAASMRSARVAELVAEAKRLSAARDHYVSHLSSNLDSISGGFEERPLGVSFARAPHERMSSPTASEPNGRVGVVFAKVGGDGLDYARPEHRAAIDNIVGEAIASGGTAEDALEAMRSAGISWVNNWNSIGAADELHALAPSAIEVRKIKELPPQSHYRFPSPGSDLGIVINRDWQRAATAGPGEPEARRGLRSR